MGKNRWAVIPLASVGPALLCAALACSGAPDLPPVLPDLHNDGGDSGSTGDAPSTCKTEDGGCNLLANCGSKIYVVQVPGNAPAAAGGTVVDGTYVMTEYKVYTGAGGASGPLPAWFRQTMSFATDDAGAPPDAATSDAGPTQQTEWREVSETSSNTAVKSASGRISMQLLTPFMSTIVFSCPSDFQPYVSPYTATGNDIVLFADDPKGKATLTYVRQ